MNRLFAFFRRKKENAVDRPDAAQQFAAQIIGLLESDPGGWVLSEHFAEYGTVRIWIANRPYADLTIGSVRIGTEEQRQRMRVVLDALWLKAMSARLETAAVESTIARMESENVTEEKS